MKCILTRVMMMALSLAILLTGKIVNASSSSSDMMMMEQTYNEDEAKMMLQYATISFCNAASIKEWDCAICDEKVPKLNVTAVVEDYHLQLQAYVGWHEKKSTGDDGDGTKKDIIISFRGTVNADIMNWIKDSGFAHVSPWKSNPRVPSKVKVHSGFYDAWKHLKPGIVAAVKKELDASNGNADIYITGHSLGGSMACLCAFDLHHEFGIDMKKTYTFGQPRTGNKKFAKAYEAAGLSSRHWRVTHWKDPVPQYPWRILGYHHVAREVFYNEDFTEVVVGDGSGESDGGQNLICNSIDCLKVPDHTEYLNMTTGDKACVVDIVNPSSKILLRAN